MSIRRADAMAAKMRQTSRSKRHIVDYAAQTRYTNIPLIPRRSTSFRYRLFAAH